MKINILELLEIQKEVNLVVKEKTKEDPSAEDYVLAFNVELFEYFNAVGFWKWWKHNHQINKEKVLDELADCFAFFLSAVDYQDRNAEFEEKEIVSPKINDELNEIFINLQNFKLKSEMSNEEIIVDLIKYIGTDNEDNGIITIERFAIAIFIATILFEEIT